MYLIPCEGKFSVRVDHPGGCVLSGPGSGTAVGVGAERLTWRDTQFPSPSKRKTGHRTLSLQLGFFLPLPPPHFFAPWLTGHLYHLVGFPWHPGSVLGLEGGGGAGWLASLQGPQHQVGLCSPGLSFPSGLPRQREGGRILGREGGRLQETKVQGAGPSPPLSCPSGHCPSMIPFPGEYVT